MSCTLPLRAGLGLRSLHLQQVLQQRPAVAWWEVHSENYFGGGAPIAALERLRADYPLSLHGVGLGPGNVEPPDPTHLANLSALARRVEPGMISEHLAWNRHGDEWFNDLLPVPRLQGTLDCLCRNIEVIQQALGRRILIENVSAYVRFADEAPSEAELLAELVARTGCGLLLDLNNLYVNQLNFGLDARAQIGHLPMSAVGEIHVAGHETFDGLVIDTHGSPVCPQVYALLAETLALTGPVPVLLERDTRLPPLEGLLDEYRQLQRRLPDPVRHAEEAVTS
jgi:uncharacterized protein